MPISLVTILQAIALLILLAVVFLFVALYIQGAFRKNTRYRLINSPSPTEEHFLQTLVGLTGSLAGGGHPTGFWVEADAVYAARLEAIRSAQQTIHFETFFMTPGHRANDFAAALSERSQAGVTIQLMIDCYGSKSLSKSYWQQLQAAGVQVRFFQEFSWWAPLDFNFRTHRKLLLIDGKTVLIGGAGVSDDWDGRPKADEAPWRDYEVRYEGSIVGILEGIFMQNWASAGGTVDLSRAIIQPRQSHEPKIVVTTSNFSLRKSELRMLFHLTILAAHHRLWLSSPYFIPEVNVRRALLEAKRKGVDVRVLTMGHRNDKPLVYCVAREHYQELLENGIEIYEYQPSMMHAKSLLVDDRWVSMGSTNVDPRSFYENDELNVSLADPALIHNIEQFLLDSFDRSRRVTLADWQRRPLWQRLQGQAGFLLREFL